MRKATRGDTIVLCVDGMETNNDYPILFAYEPDAKTPMEWVRDICFFGNHNGELSLKLKKEQ